MLRIGSMGILKSGGQSTILFLMYPFTREKWEGYFASSWGRNL